MTPITSGTTLAEVVDAHPSLARELERRGLDYCCGGRRTLGEACAESGLEIDAVVGALHDAATDDEEAAPWAKMDVVQLVDHLEATHHRYLWDELPRVEALVEKVAGVHGERHPELDAVGSLVAALRADLEPHLRKEEQVLFPMIRELAAARVPLTFHCGSLANPISVMLAEHDRVGQLLAELRACTTDYTVPDDACASYVACFRALEALEADTHLHVHKENNRLFPAVVSIEERLARGVTAS